MIEPGSRLARYEIVTLLGKGGMGEVYRARDRELGREVAIKVLPKAFTEDAGRVARFKREARAAAALNHPHICAVYEIGEHEGQPFIVMELMRGQTLEACLRRGVLDARTLIELCAQLADALDAAHSDGIFHRDIKPANIFITERGHAKLLDFGLAKTAEHLDADAPTTLNDGQNLTSPGTALGTLVYMSPEQALGRELDGRTDLFSLGAVIYEAITGRPAFSGATSAAIFDQILNKAPTAPADLNPEVAPELKQMVSKLLEKDPGFRYQSAAELLADLKRLKRDSDSGRAGVGASPGRPARSRRTVAAWVVTGAVALAAVASAGLYVSGLDFFGLRASTAPVLSIHPLTNAAGLSLSGSWSPDASQIAYDYTLNGSMDVAVMSLGGGEPRLVAGGPNDEVMPRWSPEGSRIAFLSDDGSGMNAYWVPPTGGARRFIAETHFHYLDRFTSIGAIGSQPWSPDGGRLVLSRLEPDGSVALWIAEVESGRASRLTTPPSGGGDWRAAWSHNGQWIAFHRSLADARPNLYVVPASGGEPRAVLADETVSRTAAAWSLDDRRLLFVPDGARGGDIFDLDIETGNVRRLTVGAEVSTPILSSTGRIAVSHWTHETSFFRMNAEAPEEEHGQISLSAGDNFGQRFSPDGRQIVFQSGRAGRSELWLHDAETDLERQLTYPPDGFEDRTPDWSPDGAEVVFLSNRMGPFQLWVANVATGATRRLADQAIPMDGDWWVNARVAPRWSADRNTIAYLAPGNADSTLWLIDPAGGDPRPTALSGVLRFDWYQDSRRVIYTRNGKDGNIEMVAADLETSAEALLLKDNATELSIAPNGMSVAYNSADGHFSMNRYLLPLVGGDDGNLPRPRGSPRPITFGRGVWHVHGGAWSPDSKSIVYTRDFDRGNLSVFETYH